MAGYWVGVGIERYELSANSTGAASCEVDGHSAHEWPSNRLHRFRNGRALNSNASRRESPIVVTSASESADR